MMNDLELSPAVFSILSALIEEKMGFHYELSDLDLLRGKVSVRAQEAGFHSLLDYYYFLRYDSGGEKEISDLIEALVVGETYFFREWASIQSLVDSYIEPWCAEGRRPRVWSAACSTGEEPLSLAMLLDDRKLLGQVEIVASDISKRALEKARTGRYGPRSIRQVPEERLVDRYLTSVDDKGYQVSPRLIDTIQWKALNLFSAEGYAHLGHFDAIICRNVLIYFSDSKIQLLLNRMSQALTDEGVLIVGASESLLRYGSGFVGQEKGGAFVYGKTGGR